jgi:hypothetical protein
MAGLQLQQAAVELRSLAQLAALLQQQPEVEQGRGLVGIELDGRAVRRLGLLGLGNEDQEIAEVVENRRVLGPFHRQPLLRLDGLGEVRGHRGRRGDGHDHDQGGEARDENPWSPSAHLSSPF